MDSKELKRIYRIEVQGIEAATKKVEQLNSEIQLQTQIKKEAQKILTVNPGDVAQIEKQSKVIAQSEIALRTLNAEKRIAVREADAMIKVQELEARAQMKVIEETGLAAGSYKQLYAESKRLNELYRQTAPDNPLFKKIQSEAIAAQQKVHDFNRTLSSEGTLVGEYSKGIINAFKSADMGEILRAQVNKGVQALNGLEAELNQLKTEYTEMKNAGVTGLDAIEKKLIENRKAALQLQEQVGAMKAELKSVGGIGSQITDGLKSGFNSLGSELKNIAVGFIGVQAAFQAVPALVHNMSELSDQTTNLEVELGKAAGGANDLVDGLKQLDTRTKLQGLEEIANIATKAGVAEKDLLGVTASIDKIKVAFGKDFGDVEQGTEALTKIIQIFKGSENLTGENYLKTGNAIRVLANESVASVPYLNDFAQRLAGLEQIAHVGLPNVLGLGSGFEQFGQSAETASTVLLKLIPKLASNTEQFAKYAGLTADEFKRLLESDPSEALIRFSEGIVKNKAGLVELEETLKDSEIFGPKGGGRGVAILGVLGGKADEFRKSINSAKNAMQNSSDITEAFNKKNENLASVFDKLSKKFSDVAGNRALQITIYALGSAVAFLLSNFSILIPLLIILASRTETLVGAKARLLLAYLLEKGATAIEIAQMAVQNGLRAAQTFLIAAYTSALSISTTATGLAAVAARVLAASIALVTSPIGIVIGLVTVLTTVFGVLASRAAGTANSIHQVSVAQKALNEVNKASALIYTEQIAKIDSWIAVIKSATASADTKREAVEELIKIDSRFSDILKGNIIDLNALDSAYKAVTKSIIDQANVKASADLSAQANQKVVQLATARQVLERAQVKGGFGDIDGSSGLPKEILSIIRSLKDAEVVTNIDFSKSVGINSKVISAAIKELKEREATATAEYIEFEKLHQNALKVVPGATAPSGDGSGGTGAPGPGQQSLEDLKRQLISVNAEIKALDLISNRTKEQEEKLKALRKQRNEILRAIKELGGKADRPDKLKTAEQIRDEKIKDLTTQEDTEKKLNEGRYAKREIDETAYLVKLNSIIQDYSDRKLKIVEKAGNAEKNRIAEFNLDKINSTRDTEDKIYKIKQDALDKQLAEETKTFKRDPKQSNEANALAQEAIDKSNREALVKHQTASLLLENTYHIKSIENEKKWADAIRKVDEDLKQDSIDTQKAKLKDLQEANEIEIAQFQAQGAALRRDAIEKKKSTKKIDQAEEIGVLARQLAGMNAQLPLIKKLYEEGEISAKEYYEFLAKLDDTAGKLYEATTKRIQKSFKERLKGYSSAKEFITGELSNLLTPKDKDGNNKEGFEWISEGIGEAFNLASQAMNAYFDAKKARIEEEKNYELDKLGREKDQRLSRAQSTAEEQSINRQYEKQKLDIEKKAFEEQKKQKKAEAKVALAVELANIAVQAAANPANAVTFGAAGAIQFAVLGALAAVRYGLRVSEINKEKFEHGGFASTGGEIVGPSHAFGGVPFNTAEAEGGELAIINKRSAQSSQVYSVTGTGKQIASAINEQGGGRSFAIGARINKLEYGGSFGRNISIPGDVSYLRPDSDLKEYIKATNDRIDRITVHVDSRKVEKSNNQLSKAAEINSL